MGQLIITNTPDTNAELKVKPLFGEWVVQYDGLKPGDNSAIITGRFHTPVFSHVCEDAELVPGLDLFCAKLPFTEEQFDNWALCDFDIHYLLHSLLLPKADPELGDFEQLDPEHYLLESVIPNCCGCGIPNKAIAAIVNVFSYFSAHPLQSKSGETIENADLALAYMLDARGCFIEHGSSIYSSSLSPMGWIWVLAASLHLHETTD